MSSKKLIAVPPSLPAIIAEPPIIKSIPGKKNRYQVNAAWLKDHIHVTQNFLFKEKFPFIASLVSYNTHQNMHFFPIEVFQAGPDHDCLYFLRDGHHRIAFLMLGGTDTLKEATITLQKHFGQKEDYEKHYPGLAIRKMDSLVLSLYGPISSWKDIPV